MCSKSQPKTVSIFMYTTLPKHCPDLQSSPAWDHKGCLWSMSPLQFSYCGKAIKRALVGNSHTVFLTFDTTFWTLRHYPYIFLCI